MNMRFGICCGIDDAEKLVDVGFDYVEFPVSGTAGALDDDEFKVFRSRVERLNVKPEAWNVLLPGSIRVVGPEADHEEMVGYLDRALGRVASLGGEVVVFGSGGSRRVPDGFSSADAEDQFVTACRLAGDVAARYGLVIAIEPLNQGETNLINTVAEGLHITNRVDHPAVQLLSDLYHVGRENEPLEDTAKAGNTLRHVHVASPGDRTLPVPDRDGELLRDYLTALYDAGYDARISFEGKWDLETIADRLTFLRQSWEDVKAAHEGS